MKANDYTRTLDEFSPVPPMNNIMRHCRATICSKEDDVIFDVTVPAISIKGREPINLYICCRESSLLQRMKESKTLKKRSTAKTICMEVMI